MAVMNPDLSEVPGRLAAAATNMREPVAAAVAARDGGLCTSARAALMRGAEAGALLPAGPVLADAAAATGLRCCCSHRVAHVWGHSGQAPSAPRSGRGLLPAWRTPASPRGDLQHSRCMRLASCALASSSLVASTSGWHLGQVGV